MVIAVLLCYPLTFSGFTVPAYLFCIPFMISIRKHYCSLPTAFFLSSVCQSTDVETVRCFLNACIICFASGDIQAPARITIFYSPIDILRDLKVSRFFHTFFAIPGLRVLLATVTGDSFSLSL